MATADGPSQLPSAVAKFLADIAALRRDDLEIRPLSPAESEAESEALGETMILAKEMGAVVLVDAGNSNPFCWVSRGLQSGAVLQFDHDGGIQFAFESLAAFASALRTAVERGTPIWELPLGKAPPIGDQVALAAKLVAWCTEDPQADADALRQREANVFAHLPRLDPDDLDTLAAAAGSSNFLTREAAATFMEKHARRAYLPLVRRLAVDRYPQVWRPARQVLTTLRAKQPPWTPEQEENVVGDERGIAGLVFTMVARPDGRVRVTVDDVKRRQGRRAPFTWQPFGDASHFDFSAAELAELREGRSTLERRLAELGMAVLGRLELLEAQLAARAKAPRKRKDTRR